MKKIIISIMLLSAGLLFANPIVVGPYISEVYFDETSWYVELYNVMMEDNLDNCKISSNTGEACFLPGIPFPQDTVIVITNDDLQTSLDINPEHDLIATFYDDIGISGCCYGTLEDYVLSSTAGQSLRKIGFWDDMTSLYIRFCKDNTPSMGTINDTTNYKGIFCGYVYDSQLNPVQNVEIDYQPRDFNTPSIYTNENGYFEKEMYAMNFCCDIHLFALASMDSTISIEPDSVNYYEFVFENYVLSDDHEISLPAFFYNLSNHPNPFNPSTEISFSVTQNAVSGSDGSSFVTVKIYNSKGQKIDELSVPDGQFSITWEADNFPSGVYLYKLIVGGKEAACNKMLLLK